MRTRIHGMEQRWRQTWEMGRARVVVVIMVKVPAAQRVVVVVVVWCSRR